MSEWNARDYNRQSSLQAAMAEGQLGRLTLAGSERVLDVGCGDGKITAEIADRVPHGSVLGVDPSRNMIDFANRIFGAPARPNLRFEVADVRSLPYRQQFDRVISFNALHWVPEQEAAVRSLRAALVAGGQAFLRFVPQGPRKSLEDVIDEIRQSPRWEASFAGFRTPYIHLAPEDFHELASRSGFRVIRIDREDRAWDFHARHDFLAFARATFVEWTRRLPEADWPSFITDVLDRYATVAADNPQQANTFKFYQLEVLLEAV
jgi:trans-aconitate methyltransferase